MTKTELNKFRNILEAKQAELEQFVRDRGAYPYRTTPEEMADLQADPGEVVNRYDDEAYASTRPAPKS